MKPQWMERFSKAAAAKRVAYQAKAVAATNPAEPMFVRVALGGGEVPLLKWDTESPRGSMPRLGRYACYWIPEV